MRGTNLLLEDVATCSSHRKPRVCTPCNWLHRLLWCRPQCATPLQAVGFRHLHLPLFTPTPTLFFHSAIPHTPNPPKKSQAPPKLSGVERRVPWRLAAHRQLSDDPRLGPLMQRLAAFSASQDCIAAGYSLDGQPLVDYTDLAFLAPFWALLQVIAAKASGINQTRHHSTKRKVRHSHAQALRGPTRMACHESGNGEDQSWQGRVALIGPCCDAGAGTRACPGAAAPCQKQAGAA